MPYEIWNRRYTGSKYKLADWIFDIIDNNCKDVCMESTGKYWIPIFNYLENDIHTYNVYAPVTVIILVSLFSLTINIFSTNLFLVLKEHP